MSKIHSSIQQAIEKARQHRSSDAEPSAIHRLLRIASPRDDVMEQSKIVASTGDAAAKAAYNVLRTRVLQRMRSNDWHTFLVTSPTPGDGKTLTAINLAMSLARDVNQAIVLVDLDLTRSSVARYLGIDAEIESGIGDYLLGQGEVDDILYSPAGIERLTVIPNRNPVEHPSDLMGSPRLSELVVRLRKLSTKTIVIFDMPPVLVCDDVLAFCPYVDAVLLVVAQRKTDRAALEKATAMLADYKMLGVVLNMSDSLEGDTPYAYY